MIHVTVWNEFRHEKRMRPSKNVSRRNPWSNCQVLEEDDFQVRTATLDEPEHGLTEQVLADTDVLVWWGHMAHEEVDDAIVARVQQRVWEGMGLIVLHSGHFSKIFKTLMERRAI